MSTIPNTPTNNIITKGHVSKISEVDAFIRRVNGAPRAHTWLITATLDQGGPIYAKSLGDARCRVITFLRSLKVTDNVKGSMSSHFTGASISQSDVNRAVEMMRVSKSQPQPQTDYPHLLDVHIMNQGGKWNTTVSGHKQTWSSLALARRYVADRLGVNVEASVLTKPYAPRPVAATPPVVPATQVAPKVPAPAMNVDVKEYPYIVQMPNGVTVACKTAQDVRAIVV